MKRAAGLVALAVAMATVVVSRGVAQTASAGPPGRRFSTIERLSDQRLAATHSSGDDLRENVSRPASLPGLTDYRAIFHAHASDSEHTGGTLDEILDDAQRARVEIVFLSDHPSAARDFVNGWRGVREGVLFIPGAETRNGYLLHPTRSVRAAPIGGEELLLVGGEGHRPGTGGDTRERYEALERFAREHWDVRSVEYRWSSQDNTTIDTLPYVGNTLPGAKRIWMATGFAKWGMTGGTAAALLLANRIQGYLRQQMPLWRARYPGVEHMHVAVMGCVVNGPGESKHANIGISLPGSGETPVAPVYVDGIKTVTLKGESIASEFQAIVERYVAERYGGKGADARNESGQEKGAAHAL